jgi:hypothetical protein
MTSSLRKFILLSSLFAPCVVAWSPNPFSLFGAANNHRVLHSTFPSGEEADEGVDQGFATRRAFMGAAAMNIGLIGAAPAVLAAAAESAPAAGTIYKSGKTPIVPGAKPRDKSDVKGTRKEPDFLRSIADCRSQCQNTLGSDGYARDKADCLSECQDICCKTYEQCTFDIVPRI